jgi:hypothetical protein
MNLRCADEKGGRLAWHWKQCLAVEADKAYTHGDSFCIFVSSLRPRVGAEGFGSDQNNEEKALEATQN